MGDKDLSPAVLHRIHGQLSHLLDPEAAAEHQHEHGSVSGVSDTGKKAPDLVVFQVPGQRLGQTQRDPGYGIAYCSALFVRKVVKEETDRLQMARDGLRGSSFSQQMIDIESDLLAGHLRERDVEPSCKLIEDVHVAF